MDLLPNTQTQPSPAPTPPFSPRWRGKLPVTATVGVLSVILILFVYWPWFPGPSAPVATPAATLPAVTVAATSSPSPSVTVAPTVAIYAWPSPTPALPEHVTIAVAPLVACVAAPDIGAALRNELTQQLADSTTTIDIIQIETPSDITAAQEMMIAQAIQVLIWGRCRDDGQAELQVQLNGLPPSMDELLFEPKQLSFVTEQITYVRYFALAATLYALAKYEVAATTLNVIPKTNEQDTATVGRAWLEASIVSHQEKWANAISVYDTVLSDKITVTNTTRIRLLANLGFSRLQSVLSTEISNHNVFCQLNPSNAYREAIELAEQLDLTTKDQALLHIAQGFALFECFVGDDDQAFFAALDREAQLGENAQLASAFVLQAKIAHLHRHLPLAVELACQASALDPQSPTPHVILGEIYGYYKNLKGAARRQLEQYGAQAHFEWQRNHARGLLSDLEQDPPFEIAPSGLNHCN